MKYINNKKVGIEYKIRKGAYAILKRNEDEKIGIVTDGVYFFLGGGVEEKETEIEALKRELIEETGYTIKNIVEFDEIGQYIFEKNKDGYMELCNYVYLAELDEKIIEPIEKDHVVLWIEPEDYVGKMYYEWQEYILERYISMNNNYLHNNKT